MHQAEAARCMEKLVMKQCTKSGHRGHTIDTYPFEVADQTNRNQDSRQNIWRSRNWIFPRALERGVA